MLRKHIITFILCSLALINDAQELDSKKTFFGIQTGLSGVWVNYDIRLTEKVALISEIGLDYGTWSINWSGKNEHLWVPVILLEPRFYPEQLSYKLKAGKIFTNGGGFFSVITNYHPDWFTISDYDYLKIVSNFSIIPGCGIRQYIGKNFYCDVGTGVRYKYLFSKKAGYIENDSDLLFHAYFNLGIKL